MAKNVRVTVSGENKNFNDVKEVQIKEVDGTSSARFIELNEVQEMLGLPIDVYTKQEIEEAITDENIGKIYRFKGASVPGYVANGLYIVEVDNG